MTDKPFYSIVTVCLNAGDDLNDTVGTIISQDFNDLELIVKDGGSADSSLKSLPTDARVKLFISADNGIYDAMNQALDKCSGTYVNFLNAGDSYYDAGVLTAVHDFALQNEFPDVIYTNVFNKNLNQSIIYTDSLSPLYLYRRFVCHQAQFIKREILLKLNRFDSQLTVIADVDMLLNVIVRHGYNSKHCPILGVRYHGGFSESVSANRKIQNEIRSIRRRYYNWRQRLFYEIVRSATLPRIRIWMLRNIKTHLFHRIYSSIARHFR